jgi:hypothetical protein
MVDLLNTLKNKPTPLAKKADELNTVVPAVPSLTQTLGATQKQAEVSKTGRIKATRPSGC